MCVCVCVCTCNEDFQTFRNEGRSFDLLRTFSCFFML